MFVIVVLIFVLVAGAELLPRGANGDKCRFDQYQVLGICVDCKKYNV